MALTRVASVLIFFQLKLFQELISKTYETSVIFCCNNPISPSHGVNPGMLFVRYVILINAKLCHECDSPD